MYELLGEVFGLRRRERIAYVCFHKQIEIDKTHSHNLQNMLPELLKLTPAFFSTMSIFA